MREALATADHDFVLSEPASKLKRLRETLLNVQRRGLGRTARRSGRYVSVIAAGFFVTSAAVILLNALAWQKTRHPAPLFARASLSVAAKAPVAGPAKAPSSAEMTVVPTPRPQPSVASGPAHDAKTMEKPPAQKSLPDKPPLEAQASLHPRQSRFNASPAKPHDEISELLTVPTTPKPAPKPTPPPHARPAKVEAIPAAPNKSVQAAQRTLVKLGYVLNPNGVAGVTTRQAIESYEREHGLPVRGELTPALMRRLSAETGISNAR